MSRKVQNFISLVNHLESQKMTYAILGQKRSLEDLTTGDIDIVISKDYFADLEHNISSFASKNNLLFIQCFQHEVSAKYFILYDRFDNSIICPDFCTDYIRGARLLIDNKTLMTHIITDTVEGVKINCLCPEMEFLYYLLKKVDKGEINLQQIQHLKTQHSVVDQNSLKIKLSEYFSIRSQNLLHKVFFKDSNKDIKAVILSLKKELRSNIRTSSYYYILDYVLKLKRIRHKTGLTIAVVGSDGSGKSLAIEGLFNRFKNAFRRTQYYHLFPLKSQKQTIDTTPHKHKTYSLLLSQIKLGYLIVKYNIGYLGVYFKQVKSTLIIFDRYFDDIFIDKLRFRYKGADWILRVANIFVPKPNLYIYLDAPAEVVYSRKSELTLEELNKQRGLYKTLIESKTNGHHINANQVPERVIYDIETIILDYLCARQQSRL